MDIIENEYLIASFRKKGAELVSLKSKETDTEYILQVSEDSWLRSSPVLFPIVGCLNNNTYRHKGKEYTMYIHGFANCQEFEVVSHSTNRIEYMLESNEKYKHFYPFEFKLILYYELNGKKLTVGYKVINISDETMYFSIGAHPAFNCPIDNHDRNEYYLRFKGTDRLDRSIIDMSCGLLKTEKEYIDLQENSILSIDDHLFEKDALVIENGQTYEVSILKPNKTPYVTVQFDAELFGIWSLKDKKSFVCIEPWYGRCDKIGFDGELKDREWSNSLLPNEEFNKEYYINV